MTEGKALCWGLFSGDGTDAVLDYPVEVVGLDNVDEVAVGPRRKCARTAGGQVHCWGDGPLGDNTNETALVPVEVMGIDDAVQITVDACACALLSSGEVACWGGGPRECGQPAKTNLLTPKIVQGLPPAIQVAAGGWDFTCALTEERDVYCWGDNGYGQLGAGYVGGDSHVPVKVWLPKWFEW